MQKDLDFDHIEEEESSSGYTSGFPNPAEDYMYSSLHLDKILIKHPSATFFARAAGNNMMEEGVADGDLLIIDKSIKPYDNCLAVCFIDDSFTVRRVKMTQKEITLLPAHEKQKPVSVTHENFQMIWGVVIYIIKKT